MVTVTLMVPAEWAGVVAAIVVLLITLTFVAATPPKLTVAPAAKFAPLMVVDVPPAVVPVFGEMVLIEGGGAPPPCFGKIVLSFFNAPGAEFK